MGERPAIPRELDRAVRVEAGHRCAIPTCRATSGLQIHHIAPWARVQEHTFDNLILLCANCHARADRGIDRSAMRAYKANLGIINVRYGDLERRILNWFAADPSRQDVVVDRSNGLLLSYLIDDGILEFGEPAEGAYRFSDPEDEEGVANIYGPMRWVLTDAGRHLVQSLRQAEVVD